MDRDLVSVLRRDCLEALIAADFAIDVLQAAVRRYLLARGLDLEQLDIEDQRGVRRDDLAPAPCSP